MGTCTECANQSMARGLCGKHYQRARSSGQMPPKKPLPNFGKLCARDGCEKPAIRHQLCNRHSALARSGKEFSTRELSVPEFFLLRGWNVTDSGCWEYRGARLALQAGGYGIVRRGYRAHRVSYEHFIGPIPEGMMVLHSCDNPPCVNPQHLRIGTAADNMADALARGRARGQYQLETHCRPCGAEFDLPPRTKGGRCRGCRNARSRKWQSRKRAQGDRLEG